ncbi:SDR family NAD(P)-dependent oxidoreductase [Arthrobacter russicus]|uniref:NAD(P)-dependent dehydrogenase (Short-subunit alcohol dehydrogenase family) n=1 Tax=Arthrobacter russicus TaxID=172040 RepID=A0ABU1JD88_9MICC|nr:SDR family oxidoreductase [Arthrobacter russicus]MDR6269357.1 NAD(P)-dependent dehydrogenase (short-subunit alcohol dehydrogenase family) [Arthrobacter russicus]
MRFSDKVAVVTGGAHGIGRSTVQRFLDEGARVAILDFDSAAAADLAAAAPGRAIAVLCNVLDPGSVDAAVASVAERFGGIDVLASVAGGELPTDDPMDEAYWDGIVGLNLRGPVRMIRACTPHLTASRGSIVLVSSVNALVAFSSLAYSSAKAGLGILAKNLAVELGPSGVRVNVVAPGTVRTRVWDDQEGGADRLAPLCPIGRVGEPEDIAAAIAFLASADASWITGVTLPVDGGQTAGPLTIINHLQRSEP